MLGLRKGDVLALPAAEFFEYSAYIEIVQKQDLEMAKAGIVKKSMGM